jgi:hypothetical protein
MERKGKNQQTYSSHECTCVTERRAHEILIFKKTHSFIEHHVRYILTHNRSHSHARTCSDYIVSIFLHSPHIVSLSCFTYSPYHPQTPIWYNIKKKKLNMVSWCCEKRECNVAWKGFHITCSSCFFFLNNWILMFTKGISDEKSPEVDIYKWLHSKIMCDPCEMWNVFVKY